MKKAAISSLFLSLFLLTACGGGKSNSEVVSSSSKQSSSSISSKESQLSSDSSSIEESQSSSSEVISSSEEDFDQEYNEWPLEAIKAMFDRYGYAGYEVPKLEVANAIYTVTEDPLNKTQLFGNERAIVELWPVSENKFNEYINIFKNSNHGVYHDIFGSYQAIYDTEESSVTLSISYANQAVKITYPLRQNDELIRSWPSRTIANVVSAYHSTETVPAYTGSNRGFEIVNVSSGFRLDINCVSGREDSVADAYKQTLKDAGWTESIQDGIVILISPHNEIKISCVTEPVWYPGRVQITLQPLNSEPTPSSSSSETPIPSSEEPEESQYTSVEDSSVPEESSYQPSSQQSVLNDDWPTNEVFTCLFKHGATDQLPVYGIKGTYDVTEIEDPAYPSFWFKIKATLSEADYDAFHKTYQQVLLDAGFTTRNNWYISPNNQYQIDVTFRYGGNSTVIFDIEVYSTSY